MDQRAHVLRGRVLALFGWLADRRMFIGELGRAIAQKRADAAVGNRGLRARLGEILRWREVRVEARRGDERRHAAFLRQASSSSARNRAWLASIASNHGARMML